MFSLVKFQHTIFALPFALSSLFVASQGLPTWQEFLLIILAMVFSRNAAMAFNRIVDRDIDAINPRTASREIPKGDISLVNASLFCAINACLFVVTASFFNDLTLALSPLALIIVMGYSLTKRFTHHTQLFLGLALGISPIAVWIAITGSISPFALYLGAGVFSWVAGFDIIYSTLDHDFDKEQDLKNMVVRYGIPLSLNIARVLHITTILMFVMAGYVRGMYPFYYIGCLIVAGILIYEHRLVKPNDLSRVDMAFFTLNGYVSLLFFLFVLADVYWHRFFA